MRAVIYRPLPSDPGGGPIVQSMSGTEANVGMTAQRFGGAWLEVETPMSALAFDALDSTHHVHAGALVPIGDPA